MAPDPSSRAAVDELVLTGERTLPGIPDERYWFERHVVAYRHAARLVAARPTTAPDASATAPHAPAVLDAGCGEGYGLALLSAAGAARVVGVDLDPAVVRHVRRRYASEDPRVEVFRAELMDLPLEDAEVDLTVSLQVIEHLHDIPGYLRSLRRVTRPGGTVLIGTPNRLTFTPDSDVPVNPFHTREFTAGELRRELTSSGLEVTRLLGVHHGHRLAGIERRTGTPFPELLAASEPRAWPTWLRDTVHRVENSWFELRDDELDASLDLLAECRVPNGGRR